jgi:hypothetical protein
MSMMGRFIQVSPDRLKQIIDDPSDVEQLFAAPPVVKSMPKMLGALQQKLKITPQQLAASMAAMPEPARDRVTQMLKGLGVDTDALARGEGGDDLANLLTQRLQALGLRAPSQPPASGGGDAGGGAAQPSGKGADITLEKAWHGVHYLLCGKAVPGADLASQAIMGGTDVGEDLGYGPARYFEPNKVAAIALELSRPSLEAEMMARWDPDQMTQLGIYPAVFEPDDEEWLMDEFRKLRRFYVEASASNQAVLTCIE